MRMSIRKSLTFFVFVIGIFDPPSVSADIETLNIQWSGALYGNSAIAGGFISFDTTLLPQIGTSGFVGLPDTSITDLGITISGAASGNGSFGLADFYGVSFASPSPLDLSTQLIGQQLSTGVTFGALVGDGSAGDFNLFGLSASAPIGTGNFTLTTNQGAGDILSVTSITTVPLPASWLLMAAGLPLLLSRRLSKVRVSAQLLNA